MIQIYNPENTDYEKNGNMTLFPSSATVNAKIVEHGKLHWNILWTMKADGSI